ncbi:radical SAM protein [archaeon]|nr:radical SAM protein [archaeon]|tara:strand:- start:481 stop:1551 length:1071 start_codon:yes stop_codon:yes gene_type:complete
MSYKTVGSRIKQGCMQTPGIKDLAYVLHGKYWMNTRKLKNIMLYVTNRCNSRCKHCLIWAKRPFEDLSVEAMKHIIESDSVHKATTFGLEGGEFFEHPEYEEILRLFKGRDYTLLTNGIRADLVIEMAKKHKIKKINMSLDGTKETYKYMRGVDTYENVIRIALELKSQSEIFLTYTFSPWNSLSDYEHVKKFCEDNNFGFGYNIYQNMPFMDTTQKSTKLPEQILPTQTNSEYLIRYNDWMGGRVKLPCYSIQTNVVVHPNGNVPLCQNRGDILGNVYKQSFDDIWQSAKTKQLQKASKNCNGCWSSYHRLFDIKFVRSLEKVMPKKAIEKFIGPYSFGSPNGQTEEKVLNEVQV